MTARIREAEGDLDGALDAFDEAERLRMPDFNPDVRPLPPEKARVRIRQGRLAEAGSWARERGLSADDGLTYLREFEHITLARLLLAQGAREGGDGQLRETVDLLGRLLRAAEEGQRIGSVIEILVLQALAYQARGDIAAALASLERALTLPNRRATSGCSSTRAHRWRRCWKLQRGKVSPGTTSFICSKA